MTIEKRDDQFDDLREKLRNALPPLEDLALRRDLWPSMLRRIESASGSVVWSFRVPWFDWALLGLAGAATAFFPALIPALLYHL